MPRASSRFATLAHAITSTSRQTPSSRRRLSPYHLLHLLDAGAARNDRDALLRQYADDVGHQRRGIAALVFEPLPQHAGEARRQARDGGALAQPAHDPEPRRHRLSHQRAAAGDERFLLQRQPQVRRVRPERIAVEARRCDADDRERMPLDDEARTDHRRVGAIDRLPRCVADHGNRGRRRAVVGWHHEPATEGPDAERREVAAGDPFAAQWTRCRIDVFAPDAERSNEGRKGRDLFELGRCGLQSFVQRERVHAPAFLRAALDTAVVVLADPIEALGRGHRKRPQHDRVHQRKHRGRAADADRQRRQHGDREQRCLTKLPQGISNVSQESRHRA